jgi:predicted secreted hydrolase
MRGRRFSRSGVGLVAGLLVISIPGCSPEMDAGAGQGTALTVSEILGGAAEEGFLRADAPRSFSFPEDHGPHPGFRNEWWYFTGNLATAGGGRAGYQLTLFRAELAPPGMTGPETEDGGSAWRSRTAWMGHLAVTDGEAEVHREAERFTRGALGLAGAETGPLRVWLEDWVIEETEGPTSDDRPAGLGTLRLRARQDDLAIDLELQVESTPVLQGEAGLSAKGPEPGNASYYYSIPRIATLGSVEVAGSTLEVSGTSWLDREWSTSALSPGVVGWDWFALRLSDGWSLMVYDLRREDGSITEFSHAVLISPRGVGREVDREGMTLAVTQEWESPLDGARYPSGWRLSIPDEDLELTITPLVADQEMDLAFRYWEGAVIAGGTRAGAEVSAEGFVELTGYAGLVPGER